MAMEVVNDEEPVASEAHRTVILGWSKKLPSLLRQLAVANQSLGGGEITVVAAVDVERMGREHEQGGIDMLGTRARFICGSRHDIEVLRRAEIDTASAVIVLAESQDADESDQLSGIIVRKIMKVVNAATFRGHIVVEVIDVENEPWIKKAGGDLVETVVAKDVITRLMVQCARQPGLAQVWRDILGFDKAEFYLKPWPELQGKRFVDVLVSFPDAIPCGVKVASRNSKIVLNPDDDYVLAEGDEVLVIADDDDSYAPSTSLPEVQTPKSKPHATDAKPVKKILLCGWKPDMEDVIASLEQTLGTGSEVWIFSEVPEQARLTSNPGITPADSEDVKLVHITGKPTSMKDLEALPLETFDSILLVPDGATAFDTEHEPLSTLIMIKSIHLKRLPYREARAVQIRPAGNSKTSWIDELQHSTAQSIIVSEVLKAQTKEALHNADMDPSSPHAIEISDDTVSMALAMVAEDKRIGSVLDELFAEEGNEMILRPAEMFLDRDAEELSFYDIMVRARTRNEIAIGFQRQDELPVVNPPHKDARRAWSLDDSFIVLVERC